MMILSLLSRKEMYGYEIIKELELLSKIVYHLTPTSKMTQEQFDRAKAYLNMRTMIQQIPFSFKTK